MTTILCNHCQSYVSRSTYYRHLHLLDSSGSPWNTPGASFTASALRTDSPSTPINTYGHSEESESFNNDSLPDILEDASASGFMSVQEPHSHHNVLNPSIQTSDAGRTTHTSFDDSLSDEDRLFLKAVVWKSKNNITDECWGEALKLMGLGHYTPYTANKRLSVMFPGHLEKLSACGTSYYYFGIIPFLKELMGNEGMCSAMRYRANYARNSESISDYLDSDCYGSLLAGGFIKSKSDILISISTDGFLLSKSGLSNCWAVILINMNLPPQDRVKLQNIHVVAIIPGSPADFNEFFAPIFKELDELQNGK